jgi:hypothetical protein
MRHKNKPVISNFYYSLSPEEDKIDRVCRTKGAKRNVYRTSQENSEGKRLLGTLRYRLDDIIKLDVREIGWGDMDWISFKIGTSEVSCEHGNEQSGFYKMLENS